jgi:2-dehydropantoate 2-reductase
MRVVIVGTGGVGGLVGALLARAGADVAFVARGANLEALRTKGLHVEGAIGDFSVPPLEASEDPSQLRPADVVLVALKTWQVAEMAPRLAPLLSGGGFAVPLQNGLEAHERLAAGLGAARVSGGLCHMISWSEGPGFIKQTGPAPGITVGEWDGGLSPRLEALGALFTRAGIRPTLAPRVQADVWEKALFVEAYGAVGAVARLPLGRLREGPGTRALLVQAMTETAQVAAASGQALAAGPVERAMVRVDLLPAEATASMHRDLLAGRPSELDDQTGAILRAAERVGLGDAVPLHRFLFACLWPHEQAARAAPRVSPG